MHGRCGHDQQVAHKDARAFRGARKQVCKREGGGFAALVADRADGIVTFNLWDFGPSIEQFGMTVLLPGEAVKRLEKKS